MPSPESIHLKMTALMGLGWNSIIQMDKSHALLKLNSKDELNIDVSTTPKNWALKYKGKSQPWGKCDSNLPDGIIKPVNTLISQYNGALRVILDEITDWRAFQ